MKPSNNLTFLSILKFRLLITYIHFLSNHTKKQKFIQRIWGNEYSSAAWKRTLEVRTQRYLLECRSRPWLNHCQLVAELGSADRVTERERRAINWNAFTIPAVIEASRGVARVSCINFASTIQSCFLYMFWLNLIGVGPRRISWRSNEI